MALEVGTAHLKIEPSLRDLHKKIAAEVTKIRDIEIPVNPDMDRFRQQVAAGTRGVRGVEVGVTANTERARVQVGAFATQLKTRLDAATRSLGDIRIDGDSDPIERKIWMVRQRLATLQNQKIGLDIDADEAQREIATIHAELTALGRRSPNIQVKVDTAAALAQLAALRAGFANTERNGSALRATLAMVGSGFGLMRTAIGGVVGGLGSLVGEGTRAGSAMVSLGSSIGNNASGAAGSMMSLGRGAVSAAMAFGQLVIAGAGIVALGSLIAGAGAVAVAAIGQLGGAVIALASGLVPLTGMLGTLPGLLLPIGLAAGAVAIAFGDEGLKKEAEQLKEAFTPLVSDIRSQLRPALTELLNSVEGLVPTFRRAAPAITSAISDVTRRFSDMFRSSSFKADLESILRASGQTIRDFGATAQSGMRAFMDIMIAARPVVEQLTLFIKNGAAEFANWTAEARRSGELTTFFSQAFAVFRDLMGVLGNLTGLFKDFWDSANRTGAFQATLGAINDGITRFRDYTNEAGGAWDRLMAKAGPITASLVGLVESIGKAFVDMGANVDIVPLFDRISAAITNLTPTFESIASKAVPAFEKIVAAGEKLMIAIGPEVGDTITKLALAFEGMAPSLETIIPFLGDMAVEIGKVIIVVGNFIDHLVTLPSIIKSALSGDFSGAAEKWRGLQERTREVTNTMQELNSKADEAKTGVAGVGGALNALPPGKSVLIDLDTSSMNADTQAAIGYINSVPENWFTRFAGDMINLGAVAVMAQTEIGKVPEQRRTNFTGDASQLSAAGAEAVGHINRAPQTWLTHFAGDVLRIMADAGTATGAVNSVPGHHPTTFTGEPGSVIGAAGQATGAISGVPPSHHTPITGDAGSAVGAAGQATGAINSVPDRKDTRINAETNAGSVVDSVRRWLDGINGHTVTTFIDTVRRFFGDGGMIMASDGAVAMASGGLLPMAQGDTLDRLRPMSGRSARIVPPNTWRVIGDRMVDDEAFIPINNSAWSTAILGETARRKGFALTPLTPVAPMARGGINLRDERAWEWIRRLLEGLRGRPGGGGGSSPGPIGGVGGPAGPAPVGQLPQATLRTMFQTTGGMASMTRANPLYAPMPYRPYPPDPGPAVSRALSGISFARTGSQWLDAFLEEVAEKIRSRGGDPQILYSRR